MAAAPVGFPPVHIPRPYERPRAPLAARVEVPTADGATIRAFVYAPEGTRDEPGTPFGIDLAVPPVLMLHGNGEEHGIFGPVIDAVVAGGRAVVAVDSRAQGESSRGSAPLSYELMAADACEVMARLGVPEAHVLGFSDGGILGLLLARDEPDHVLSLTALGANLTPAGLPEEDGRWMADAAAANRAWAERGWEGATLEDGTPVPAPAEAARTAELLQLMVDQPQIDAASLGAIRCPVTVMAGEFDVVLPAETRRIAEAIPGAREVIVPGAEHTLPKVAPDDVARELLATVAARDVRREPQGEKGAPNVAVAPLPDEPAWGDALDALYAHVCERPGTSGWVAGVWPPAGMARGLLAQGVYWGAFDAADVCDGRPREGAALLGAVAVNHDADMGDGNAPGHGSGLGGPGWEPLPASEVAGWHLLAVDPDARGRGVAQALLDGGCHAARGLGARVVRLNTSVTNVASNALYARAGFVRHRPVWLPYPGLPMPGWTNLWERRL